jgi:hypothetical protein
MATIPATKGKAMPNSSTNHSEFEVLSVTGVKNFCTKALWLIWKTTAGHKLFVRYRMYVITTDMETMQVVKKTS